MQPIHDEVITILDNMKRTFLERGATYKDNYLQLGEVMAALFPDGLTLKTPEDFVRYDFLNWHLSKITRLVQTNMTHEDSAFDSTVYCAMLTAWIHNNNGKTRT
jgi:hypothetical protein